MFGIGMPEMLLILAIALIVIGPKKLPDLAKALGRAMGEFKKASREFRETMEIDTELQDVRKAFRDMNPDLHNTAAPEAAAEPPEADDAQAPSSPQAEAVPKSPASSEPRDSTSSEVHAATPSPPAAKGTSADE